MTGRSNTPPRPTRADLEAARQLTVPDVIAPGLKILFVGINPGLYTAATGCHFARPGNRFWPALYAAGLTPRRLAPADQRDLLEYGCGITNLVARASAAAAELSPDELQVGGQRLAGLVDRYHPRIVAVLGISAYRAAFRRPQAALGLQPDYLAGAPVWVLPNPSGLNAHFQLADLAELFRELRQAAESDGPVSP